MLHKLRHLKLLILCLIRGRTGNPLEPVVCRFLITPFDVEATRASSHTYMAFAGLGRWCYSFHNIDWKGLVRERWAPLTHSEIVHYRRAVSLFKIVEVATTVVWWDDKMFYFEHRITQGKILSAIIHSRGAFFRGRERLPPQRCVRGLPVSPPMNRPEIVDFWDSGAKLFQTAAQPPDPKPHQKETPC